MNKFNNKNDKPIKIRPLPHQPVIKGKNLDNFNIKRLMCNESRKRFCSTFLFDHVSSQIACFLLTQLLSGFFSVADLVVDLTDFYKQYRSIKPYSTSSSSTSSSSSSERLHSIRDRAQLDNLYRCILCACCSTACPSYW